jgi:DNA-binding NtrC family response regulator
MHIFIVDDEEDIVTLTTAFLKRYGHKVTSCSTYSGAKEEITNHKFDAYLLDVHLPDGTGLGLANEIQNLKSDANIVLMSAYDDVESQLDEHPYIKKFIKKPFRYIEVLNAIHQA